MHLADRLRLIVITDRTLAAHRSVAAVAEAALEAGAPAIQLRNRGDSARELLAVGHDLRAMTLEHDALLFVNDRLDVAMALDADGVHLGPDDPPVAAVRRFVDATFLIGYSSDEVTTAQEAVEDGASYIGCGTVYATSTKRNAGEVIGLEGLDRVAKSVSVPVVGIGGITPDRAVEVATTAAAGVAVVRSVMQAPNVEETVRRLLAPWGGRDR